MRNSVKREGKILLDSTTKKVFRPDIEEVKDEEGWGSNSSMLILEEVSRRESHSSWKSGKGTLCVEPLGQSSGVLRTTGEPSSPHLSQVAPIPLFPGRPWLHPRPAPHPVTT